MPAWLVDLGLMAFACVGYSAGWRLIAGNAEPLNQQNLMLTGVYTFVAGLLFLFFFLPARAAYLVEEGTFATTPKRRRRLHLSIAVAALSALSPLYHFEDGKAFVSTRRAKQLAHERAARSLGEPVPAPPSFASLAAARAKPAELELDGVRGLVVPDDLPGLADLERLALRNLRLDEVPPGVARLRSLRTLSLAGNELREVPEWINDLPQLETLALNGNPLKRLPFRPGGVPRLRTLILSHAKLGALPQAVARLPLQFLLATYCGLEQLPEGLGQTGTLLRLDLRGNAIRRLPESLSKSPLKSLDWGASGLEAFPEDLLALASLEYLSLSDNRIAAVPEGLAAALPNLKRLDLRKNPLAPAEVERLRAALPGVEVLVGR